MGSGSQSAAPPTRTTRGVLPYRDLAGLLGWSRAKTTSGIQTAPAPPVASAGVVAYADLTLLGGRHRTWDLDSAGLPELHPIADRVVCAAVSDGNAGWPAVNRDCDSCGKQLWVSVAMLELVDSRAAQPVCLGCHRSDYAPMKLHHAAMPPLHLAGMSADAWRCVAVLNGLPLPT